MASRDALQAARMHHMQNLLLDLGRLARRTSELAERYTTRLDDLAARAATTKRQLGQCAAHLEKNRLHIIHANPSANTELDADVGRLTSCHVMLLLGFEVRTIVVIPQVLQ